MGVVVAQMSKISKVVRPEHYHMLRYKACICQALSIVILVIGTYRFFCEQNAIHGIGKRSSQWSLLAAGLLILLVSGPTAMDERNADGSKLSCSFFIMLIMANTDTVG